MIHRAFAFYLHVVPAILSLSLGLGFSPSISIAQENPPPPPLPSPAPDQGAEPRTDRKARPEDESRADLKKMEKDIQQMKEQIERLLQALEGTGPSRPGRLYRSLPDDEFQDLGPGYPREFRRGLVPPGRPPADGRYRGRGLGVRVREVDPTLASQLKLEKGQGVVVEMVLEGSPASAGGLLPHDVILLVNGRAIAGSSAASAVEAMIQAVAAAPAGQPVPVEVIRGAEKTRLDLTLKEKEKAAEGGTRKA